MPGGYYRVSSVTSSPSNRFGGEDGASFCKRLTSQTGECFWLAVHDIRKATVGMLRMTMVFTVLLAALRLLR
jgi:hypothetical protein